MKKFYKTKMLFYKGKGRENGVVIMVVIVIMVSFLRLRSGQGLSWLSWLSSLSFKIQDLRFKISLCFRVFVFKSGHWETPPPGENQGVGNSPSRGKPGSWKLPLPGKRNRISLPLFASPLSFSSAFALASAFAFAFAFACPYLLVQNTVK